LKAPQEGESVINDLVQGEVRVANAQLDDMVLLRADGTPTYMLAVVVDDHDMEISHVIRGDDHLTNAFRQTQLFQALGWDTPAFAHIPLIHGADGAKLSKRHGALGVDAYRDQGFLPEALTNYLLRLGWSHGDDEIIDTDQAIEWFGLEAVGKSPSRFDVDKLTALNGQYVKRADDARLAELITPAIEAEVGGPLAVAAKDRILAGMPGLKDRAKTVTDLAESAVFYALPRPLKLNEKASKLIDDEAQNRLKSLRESFAGLDEWTEDGLEDRVRAFAEETGAKMGKIAQPLRAVLTGTTVSPSIFEVLIVLGREESLGRMDDALGGA
ncbi:MAG: glutamate--tRNA ligase, partial [Magnetovibrio sp.]|nr:glutamate--tRNA ligase [Magnetovibrio sp.]